MTFEYFETDQIKYAVRLNRALKKAGEAEFDVLKFTQNWVYAERVLNQAVVSSDEAASDQAVEIMQLRAHFLKQEPARAKKLGAIIDDAGSSGKAGGANSSTASSEKTERKQEDNPDLPKNQYLKSLR